MGTRGVPESGAAGRSAAAGSEGRNRRRLDSRALRTAAPILVGHWPFAIAYVLVGRGAGLEAGELLLMSATVFAGASQLIVVTMMREGIFAVGVLTATTLLVNVRHLLMGASLAPHLERYRFSTQALAAFLLIDESFALTMSETESRGFRLRYFFSVGVLFYANWLISAAVGIALTDLIRDPEALPLDFVMPASFMVLVMPFLRTLPGRVAAGVAAAVSLIGSLMLPGYWYVAVAAVAAAIAGMAAETMKDATTSDERKSPERA